MVVADAITLLRSPLLKSSSAVVAVAGPSASESQCTVALIKNIVGTGVLTLPAGVARLTDSGATPAEAIALAVPLLLLFGALNAWGFLLIGRVCVETEQPSYVGAWTSTLGPRLAALPAVASLLLCSTAAIACATVIADTGTDLLAALFALPAADVSRTAVLFGCAASVLTPLCLLPSLAPLGTASYFGVAGVLVTALCMIARLAEGTYDATDAAALVDAGAAAAEAAGGGAGGGGGGLGSLPSAGAIAYFVSLVSNAFLAHYNAPSVLTALAPQPAGEAARAGAPEEEAAPSWLAVRLRRAAEINEEFAEYARRLSPPLLRRLRIGGGKGGDEGGGGKGGGGKGGGGRGGGGKGGGGVAAYEAAEGESGGQLAAYRRVVLSAFGLSAVLFVAIGAAGYLTFGAASDANILNSYASADPLAVVARLGVGAAVLCEFPLLERPFRTTLVEMLKLPPAAAARPAVVCSSVAALCGVAALGIDLDTISALGGATGGSLLIYVAPALMALRSFPRGETDGIPKIGQTPAGAVVMAMPKPPPAQPPPPRGVAESAALVALAVTGLAAGLVGTAEALR